MVPIEAVGVDVEPEFGYELKGTFRTDSNWSDSTRISSEADDVETVGFDGDTPSSGPTAEDGQGLDEDEYYAFLREMGCSFDGDEQDISDDEEGSCSGSEDEDDDVDSASTGNAPNAVPKCMISAACDDNLPAFEGLDAAGDSKPKGAQGYPMAMETQNADQNRPQPPPFASISCMGAVSTPIVPGPSVWLLRALKVASATSSTTHM